MIRLGLSLTGEINITPILEIDAIFCEEAACLPEKFSAAGRFGSDFERCFDWKYAKKLASRYLFKYSFSALFILLFNFSQSFLKAIQKIKIVEKQKAKTSMYKEAT